MVCKIYTGNNTVHKFKDKKINLRNWHISFAQLLNVEVGMFFENLSEMESLYK